MPEDDFTSEHLRHSTLGAVLDERHLETLGRIAVPVHKPTGAILFREGSPADALWVMCSGRIALDMQVPGRNDVRVLTLGPRDRLGWSALVGDGSMSATATVINDAELLRLPAQPLTELCLADHTLGYAVMGNVARAMANRLRGTRLQLLDLFAETEQQQTPSAGVSS